MDVEDHMSNQIIDAFGADKSLYDILEVQRNASEAEIKRAYKKLALKHHPDKGGDAEIFKALSAVHSILSDTEKRKIYDETGNINTDDALSGDFNHWYEYFRNLFPKVTVEDIDKFSCSYKGSEKEKEDIIEAYYNRKGNFREVMQFVILAEEEDENRIANIINRGIADGEVELLPAYKKVYSKMSSQEASAAPARKKRKNKQQPDDMDALAAMIKSRNQSREDSTFGSILAKYGGDDIGETNSELSDAEFQRVQATLGKGRTSRAGKMKSKARK